MPTTQAIIYNKMLKQNGRTSASPFGANSAALIGARRMFRGVGGGEISNFAIAYSTSATDGQNATGWFNITTGSGVVGAIINGVTISTTWATSDTATAGVLSGLINASVSPLVQNMVRSSRVYGTITCSGSAAAGSINFLGANITIGTAAPKAGQYGYVQSTGTGATDAAALAACINTHPSLNGIVIGQALATVCRIVYIPDVVPTNAGITIVHPSWTRADINTNNVGVLFSTHKGRVGNAISLAATGTGVTVSGALFTGGTGDDATLFIDAT